MTCPPRGVEDFIISPSVKTTEKNELNSKISESLWWLVSQKNKK